MNILFMPSWYATEEEPNSGVFFVEQAKKLQSAGNSVTIAIVDILNYPYRCRKPKYKIIKESHYGIEVYRIVVPSLMTGHVPYVFFHYYAHYYKRLINFLLLNGMKFDVMYAHSFWHAGYVGTMIKSKYNIPLITQEHRSMLITGEFSAKVNKYLKESVLNSDVFYCVSNRLRDNIYYRTGLNHGIDLLPNMTADIFRFRSLENKVFTYSFVGTLNENKRVLQLIRCFEKIRENNRNVYLKIAGDGPLREKVDQLISQSDLLSDSVAVLGFLDRESVLDLLTESNVLVLPSAFETFGVVCIEALAVGRPVICTRNGAVDFINDDNGILIDVDSDNQLISAMERMYSNYSTYNLSSISEQCLKNYSGEAIMTKLISKMDELKEKECDL